MMKIDKCENCYRENGEVIWYDLFVCKKCERKLKKEKDVQEN